jgi:ABC-type transporter Mla subunit MlaD
MSTKLNTAKSLNSAASKSDELVVTENTAGANGLTGLFVFVGLVLLYCSFCWFKNAVPFTPKQRFTVLFHDVAGMSTQAPVYVDGVRIGAVEDIRIAEPHQVRVALNINENKAIIPQGSKFMILANGMVGAKYVEIVLPYGVPNNNQPLNEHSVVIGEDPTRPEIAMTEVMKKLSALNFMGMQNRLNQSMDSLNHTAGKISTLSTKLEPVAENAAATEKNVSALANDLRAPVQQVHQMLDRKHPLVHMIFGRPGHIKSQKNVTVESTVSDAQQQSPNK